MLHVLDDDRSSYRWLAEQNIPNIMIKKGIKTPIFLSWLGLYVISMLREHLALSEWTKHLLIKMSFQLQPSSSCYSSEWSRQMIGCRNRKGAKLWVRKSEHDSLGCIPRIAFQTILLLYSFWQECTATPTHGALKWREMTQRVFSEEYTFCQQPVVWLSPEMIVEAKVNILEERVLLFVPGWLSNAKVCQCFHLTNCDLLWTVTLK